MPSQVTGNCVGNAKALSSRQLPSRPISRSSPACSSQTGTSIPAPSASGIERAASSSSVAADFMNANSARTAAR